MITCTYCGNANPDNRRECQYCGAPLSNAGKRSENGPGFQQSVQPVQPVQSTQVTELPAWLQSLRSDASTPSSEPAHYSAADFIDENDLPRWMQSSNGTEEEKDASQQQSSLRPSSSSSPNTDEGYVRNISAHDLIDEQMLPAWMKSDSGVGGDETSSAGQRNISASGLIQQDSVPDWMRNFPQDQPGTGGNGSFGPQATPLQSLPSSPSYPSFQPQAAQGFASQPLSAHDLIDQQSLPPWLREQGFQGNQAIQGSQGSQQAQSARFQQGEQQGGQQGGQQGSQQSWNASYQGQNSGAKGFSASSLVDMNSLPSWMRNGDASAASTPSQQGSQSYSTNSAQPTIPSSQGQAMWQNMPQQQQMPSQQGGLSANSFIDVNALPDWLRAASEQGQLTGQGVQGGQGGLGGPSYATPPRADNVRVPSRPRGDIGMNEGNEAAANAFASMLGVASHAPQFPQSQQVPQNLSYPASPASQASPMAASSSQYQNNQNATFAGPGALPANTAQAAPQPSYMNNIGVAQVSPMGAQPAGYPMYGQPSSGQNAMQYNQVQGQQGQSYQPMQPMQSMQQHQSHPSSQLNQEKPQKRGGLFEAIRNFFFRQS